MAQLSEEEIAGVIRTIGMYRTKSANVKKLSQILAEQYGGEVPGDYDELEYPMGFLVRKVTTGGEIILNGLRITIGYALRGWHVGLKPLDEGHKFQVYLADFLLGTLDVDSCCFYPLETLKSD